MAKKLAGHVESFNMDDPEVELEVEQEVAQEAEFDDFMFLMEEDPEMCAAAGLPGPTATTKATTKATPMATPTANPIDCEECDGFCLRDEMSIFLASFIYFNKNLILFKMLHS